MKKMLLWRTATLSSSVSDHGVTGANFGRGELNCLTDTCSPLSSIEEKKSLVPRLENSPSENVPPPHVSLYVPNNMNSFRPIGSINCTFLSCEWRLYKSKG